MSGAVDQLLLYWEDVSVGDEVPAIVVAITRYKTALIPATTLDGFPGHYSSGFARSRGLQTVFMNTMPLLGLFNRHGTDWAGPGAFIARQHIHMIRPVYAGDVVTVSGKVAALRERETPSGLRQALADVDAEIRGQGGDLLVKGGVSLVLRKRH
jgi:acyl dehydratase